MSVASSCVPLRGGFVQLGIEGFRLGPEGKAYERGGTFVKLPEMRKDIRVESGRPSVESRSSSRDEVKG